MDLRTAQVPFARPGFATAVSVALGTMVFGAACAAVPSIMWLEDAVEMVRECPWGPEVLAATTAAWTVVILTLVQRANSRLGTALRVVLGGMVAGVLNAGTSCGLIVLVETGRLGDALSSCILACLPGLVWGAPVGLAFGLAFTPLTLAVKSPPTSLEGADLLFLSSGAWLFSVCAFCWSTAPWGTGHNVVGWLLGIGAVVGSLLAAAAAGRLVVRRVWLSRVCSGRDPRWTVIPLERVPVGDLMRTMGGGRPANAMLIRRPREGMGEAYRHSLRAEPLALVRSN